MGRMTDRESRYLALRDFDLRAADGDGMTRRFSGYAAVFDQPTDLGGFREQIARGAFRKTIRDGGNVAFLFNHNEDTVMASTAAGTLRLREDKVGLRVEADLDMRDPDAQRLVTKMEAGNVRHMSFAFSVVKDDWDDSNTPPLRTLREVRLYDASAVLFPAYPQTSAEVRSRLADMGIDPDLRASRPDIEMREPFRPTAAMADEAQRGLDWRSEYGRGGTAIGIARARDIANRRDLSLDTVGRMVSYFARHAVDREAEGWSPGEDGYPSNGRIAWALWGGDAGRAWAESIWAAEGRAMPDSGDDADDDTDDMDSPALDVRGYGADDIRAMIDTLTTMLATAGQSDAVEPDASTTPHDGAGQPDADHSPAARSLSPDLATRLIAVRRRRSGP